MRTRATTINFRSIAPLAIPLSGCTLLVFITPTHDESLHGTAEALILPPTRASDNSCNRRTGAAFKSDAGNNNKFSFDRAARNTPLGVYAPCFHHPHIRRNPPRNTCGRQSYRLLPAPRVDSNAQWGGIGERCNRSYARVRVYGKNPCARHANFAFARRGPLRHPVWHRLKGVGPWRAGATTGVVGWDGGMLH